MEEVTIYYGMENLMVPNNLRGLMFILLNTSLEVKK
jgi:hypothetical protein